MDVISVDGEKNKRSACVDEIGMFWLRAFACFPLSASFFFPIIFVVCWVLCWFPFGYGLLGASFVSPVSF